MYRVLIAEDEALIQAGIQASVPWNQLNMQVIACCSDGASAWQCCQQEEPDILITDIRMPVMDGLALIRNVREHSLRCRIIIITCVEDFSIIKDILDKDITAYLLKATMTTEDILNTLVKAKTYLDAHTASSPSSARSERRSFRDLLRAYVLNHTITYHEFSRHAADLSSCSDQFGAMMLIRFHQNVDEKAITTVRKILEKRLSLLGTCVLLDLPDGVFVLAPQAVEPALLRSCFSGITAALQESLDLEIHAAVYSGALSAEALPGVYRDCLNVLEFPYFYPAAYYDLAATDITNPAAERTGVTCFADHPICKGLIHVGSKRLLCALQEMQSTYGTDVSTFVRALTSVADVLSLHLDFPANLIEEIQKAPNASAAASLLYETLPACERHSLYAREIDDAVEYLCNNFSERAVKLGDLAERSNFSVGYFSLLFRRNIGLSFTEYLTILRMEKARQLLETTQMSVRQVSDSCGFTAVSYFTRYFSQKANCSPKEWRKHHCSN